MNQMTSKRVLLDNLIRRVFKRRKIGMKTESDYLSVVTSKTAMLEIKESDETSSDAILCLNRKHNREQVANRACYLVDQTEFSESQLEQKSRDCGESSKRMKVDLGAEDGKDDHPDLISKLPDEVLHKILSWLRSPKDLARLATLSRRWRAAYSSFFILKFDQRKFSKDVLLHKGHFCATWNEIQQKNAVFRDFVTSSLQNYVQQNLHIDKIMLHMTTQGIQLAECMDDWLRMADQSKIRELDIHFPILKKNVNTKLFMPRHFAYDRLFCISTLESLKLYGCRLDKLDMTEIKLPNLKKLCLGKLYINEEMIENMIRCCPDIEHLGLIFCTGVSELRITGLSMLNKLELHCCHELTSIVVEAPSLQTFWLHGGRKTISKIDLPSCSSLKVLSLEVSTMRDEEFQHLFCSFPFLEILELSECHSLESIRVSSQLLKKLVLRRCKGLTKTEIDAPNLISFEFQGEKKPPVAWNPCGLKEAKIAFKIRSKIKHPDRLRHADYNWFSRFRDFLKKFDAARGLKLLIRWRHGVIMHKDLSEILLPTFFDIRVEVIKSSKECEDILDYALSTWHPKMLSVVSSTDSKLTKVMLAKMKRQDNGVGCCKYTPHSNKCWRHFLKDAEMGDLENLEDETSCWITWLNSHPTKSQKTTNFSLSWVRKTKAEILEA